MPPLTTFESDKSIKAKLYKLDKCFGKKSTEQLYLLKNIITYCSRNQK